MSRRDYSPDDRYDDRRSTLSRRPRERNYVEEDVDIRSRYDGPARSRYEQPAPSRRNETMVKERETDTVMTQGHRTERPRPRQPDFLREDYGRNSNAGPLVVREDRREEDDYVSRAPTRRRSLESNRSRPPPARTERVERDEVVYRERDGPGPPYPRSERGSFGENDFAYRERPRSRAPPPNRGGERTEEKIDIRIREDEQPERRPPPPRSNYGERDVEEVRIRRDDRSRPPPPRSEVDREEITFSREERSRPPPQRNEVDKEEITFRETRDGPPREQYRGRDSRKEELDIDIDIRERSAPPPRQRSMSRGALVRKDHEEWVVRKRREPSPSPPRDYEKEQIVIRRKERTPSPEPPPREPTPEPTPPPPPPPAEPVYRPPIIQEVITHHRHIDHGIERARSPTPPPPPAPAAPSPPPKEKEEDLEISIRRQGTRNGKTYDEEITFEHDTTERDDRQVSRNVRSRDVSRAASRHGRSQSRRSYDDDVAAEADYYNRRVSSRAYPGEAWNGATKDWGLVDIPPGTERVAMDGVGGGRQEITWERYNGERRGKFYPDDRYDDRYGNGAPTRAALPPPEPSRDDYRETTRITERRITDETSRHKTKDKMWTEVTKDLVIKEAIEEKGYEYEETDEFFYVMEYLRYEDVLKLVETTEDIRRERRDRLREIQWQRESYDRPKALPPPQPRPPPPPSGRYDERITEREWYYDRDGRRYR